MLSCIFVHIVLEVRSVGIGNSISQRFANNRRYLGSSVDLERIRQETIELDEVSASGFEVVSLPYVVDGYGWQFPVRNQAWSLHQREYPEMELPGLSFLAFRERAAEGWLVAPTFLKPVGTYSSRTLKNMLLERIRVGGHELYVTRSAEHGPTSTLAQVGVVAADWLSNAMAYQNDVSIGPETDDFYGIAHHRLDQAMLTEIDPDNKWNWRLENVPPLLDKAWVCEVPVHGRAPIRLAAFRNLMRGHAWQVLPLNPPPHAYPPGTPLSPSSVGATSLQVLEIPGVSAQRPFLPSGSNIGDVRDLIAAWVHEVTGEIRPSRPAPQRRPMKAAPRLPQFVEETGTPNREESLATKLDKRWSHHWETVGQYSKFAFVYARCRQQGEEPLRALLRDRGRQMAQHRKECGFALTTASQLTAAGIDSRVEPGWLLTARYVKPATVWRCYLTTSGALFHAPSTGAQAGTLRELGTDVTYCHELMLKHYRAMFSAESDSLETVLGCARRMAENLLRNYANNGIYYHTAQMKAFIRPNEREVLELDTYLARLAITPSS